MNVLIISQCNKNALVQTRRILDQFAERRGARTWQTHITQKGLDTLRMLLKRSARRNTAVACHWIRGSDHTELLWIVGNPKRFNERGAVPTHTTQKNILRQRDENDWHTLQGIQILSAIAALFHDFGKACQVFQTKLERGRGKPQADAYRHEWVSLRLFQAFVGAASDDQLWLSRLAELDADKKSEVEKSCLEALIKDGFTNTPGSPFDTLPPVAAAIGWLILTHHMLPRSSKKQLSREINFKKLQRLLKMLQPEWNNAREDAENKEDCWTFPLGLPFSSKSWCARASYWGKKALACNQLTQIDWLNDLFSLHMARISLMLADHYYSSLPAQHNLGDAGFLLFANTDRDGEKKQRLDEHLIGVARDAKRVAQALPLLMRGLPSIARHKGFKRRAQKPQFRWQDQAYDLACALRERTNTQGFFGVNMASTGCGKTLANGRIMYGLSNPRYGARFSIALGLRTLTLQTGEVYRKHLALGADDLAVLLGSTAIKELFELGQKQNEDCLLQEKEILEACGSESAEQLMAENEYVHYEGSLYDGPLTRWLKKNEQHTRKLLSAPILTCTIDQLIGATEATRGGRQIVPMLRLLTSDLILDEPDDFDINDLPALTRLVHWAGMLGCRILLSSATLPPHLIEGLFSAYKAGRVMYQKSRGVVGAPLNICCAWFDEYQAEASEHADSASFKSAHDLFVSKRLKKLRQAEIRRRAVIKPLNVSSKEPAEIRRQVAEALRNMLHELHRHHHEKDPETGKRVSFGLIRLAHIDPLIDIAEHLFALGAETNYRIKLCCYHSRHLLITRNMIENQLDHLLNRRKDIFQDPLLRKTLKQCEEDNIIYVVLASPVAEVGRDHDYDWAILEPSSMRSIIQAVGRVRRHRTGACEFPNIYLLSTNIASLEKSEGKATYCHPGFEKQSMDRRFLLNSHDLNELLRPEQYECITAEPRICASADLRPQENLVDLEHARLKELMQGEIKDDNLPVNLWWDTQATLGGELQRATP